MKEYQSKVAHTGTARGAADADDVELVVDLAWHSVFSARR
jgi:hypothetical protein